MNTARKNFFDSVVADDSRRKLRRFSVAAQFKAVMLGEGVSQQQLAERLQKDKAQVSRQLAGNTNMTVDTMYEFADALGKELHIVVGDVCAKSLADTWLSLDFTDGTCLMNNIGSLGTKGQVRTDYSFDHFEAMNEEILDVPVLSVA